MIKKMKLFSLITLWFMMISCYEIKNPGERIPLYSDYVKAEGTEYLEFIAYGDAGKGGVEQQWTADEMSSYVTEVNNDIDFILNLGDSFYNDGVTSTTDPLWDSLFEEVYDSEILNMPFYSILGNHDYRGNINAQINYISPNNDRWQMPSRYYSITKKLPDNTEIEFMFLDSERLFYGDAEQLVWLDDKLDSSTARWKIVVGHRPLFSYGYHGFSGPLIPRMQPLLNNRADLYIAGHEHDMQILGPLNDVYYLVTGSAGTSRPTGVDDLTIFAVGRIGFMSFIISNTELVCRVIETNSGVIYSQILKSKN